MEVIKHGNSKEWLPNYVRLHCPNCGCEFELLQEETNFIFGDTIYVKSNCPECKKDIKASLEKSRIKNGKSSIFL